MNTKKELSHQLFLQNEEGRYHKAYEEELKFYELVKKGDLVAIRNYSVLYVTKDIKDYGMLSKDPLKNLVYHFIVLAAMLSRICIEGGLPIETSYTLSDLFIRSVDECKSISQVQSLHQQMIIEYTRQMQGLSKSNPYSKVVTMALDFISTNIHKKITLDALSEYTGREKTYLSKRFRQEVHKTISSYIMEQKVEEITTLLKFDSIPLSEIASDFSFSSQSHLTKVFHKYTGYTPKQYRDHYYRKEFQ